MSNDTPEDRYLNNASITDQTALATDISLTYKVLGEDALASGASVLGKNTAGSGTAIGV